MNSQILIVDDESAGRQVIEAMLAGQGYRLEYASNGPEALRLAESLLPDLILLDVMMPGMDGFEVCRRFRATPKLAEVPVVILTALDDRAALIQGIDAGADDFLSKPVDRQELSARVRTITRLNRYRILLEQRESLRDMAGRVVAAQEQERQRISRELHDDLGQSLTAHIFGLSNLQSDLPLELETLRQRLNVMIADGSAMLEKTRRLAQALRPPVLDTLGLDKALKSYCREFSRRTRLPIIVDLEPEAFPVSDPYAITLFRVLQEALTNISRHARANQVWVDLGLEGDSISLTVQDDGCGFDVKQSPSGGIGIIGMRERLALVGGQLMLNSTPGWGTILSARLPLSPASLTGKEPQ
jgi:signal transduction histidine kinase